MNVEKAYNQFASGTADVAGNGGGSVKNLGWDYGQVNLGSYTDYSISDALLGGSLFTSTLRWNQGSVVAETATGDFSSAAYSYFANLDLSLYRVTDAGLSLVATSATTYMNTEHISFNLTATGNYLLRVVYTGNNYDFTGSHLLEGYGLAWSGTAAPVPEPASMLVLAAGACALLRRRRNR